MLVIIGCGNTTRSDDGVGVVVARRLAATLGPAELEQVQVHDAGTDGMGVMYRARGASALIIVDATTGVGEPGHVYEVPGEELAAPPQQSLNLHDFRWDHALYVGRKIYGDAFPADVTVYLIEAQSLALGLELTPVVTGAATKVVRTIRARIDLLTGRLATAAD